MKVSEVIELLERAKANYGDVEVKAYTEGDSGFDLVNVDNPDIYYHRGESAVCIDMMNIGFYRGGVGETI